MVLHPSQATRSQAQTSLRQAKEPALLLWEQHAPAGQPARDEDLGQGSQPALAWELGCPLVREARDLELPDNHLDHPSQQQPAASSVRKPSCHPLVVVVAVQTWHQ